MTDVYLFGLSCAICFMLGRVYEQYIYLKQEEEKEGDQNGQQ